MTERIAGMQDYKLYRELPLGGDVRRNIYQISFRGKTAGHGANAYQRPGTT